MYKKLLMIALIVSLCIPIAAAQDSIEECTNSTYRYWEKNIHFNNTLYTWNDTDRCSYGCLNGKCLPAPSESDNMALVVGLMLVALFFVYSGLSMDRQTHGVIQVMFLFVGILFVIVDLAVMSELADYSSIAAIEAAVDNGYLLGIYIFWFILAYFVIIFIYKLMVSMGKLEPIKWSL